MQPTGDVILCGMSQNGERGLLLRRKGREEVNVSMDRRQEKGVRRGRSSVRKEN